MIKIATNITSTAWNTFYINNNWIENPNSLLPQGAKQTHIGDSALISVEAVLLEASELSTKSELIAKKKNVLSEMTRSLETDIFAFASLLSLEHKNHKHKKAR